MVVIVGAGLSGLLIGYRLKVEGIPFKILEARERIGGRIYTVVDSSDTPLEMGATWFGNQHVQLRRLLHELGLSYYEQYMMGTSFFQPLSTSPASAIQIPSQSPSYRIANGTSSIIDQLAKRIGNDNIFVNRQIKSIDFSEKKVHIISDYEAFTADRVVLALPPKLWANHVTIKPMLPKNLLDTALSTHTWMENAIKVALSYPTPFWRNNGQSGTLFSNSGPVTEFYDHCNSKSDKYALCGFLHPEFGNLSHKERKALIIEQLETVFGTTSKEFIGYTELDWRKEDKTFSKNSTPLFPHQNNGSPIFRTTYFDSKLFISSSESSTDFPGYMEGAVVSANFTFERIKEANKV
ncbi:MAG: NAD(P)/FAD-dependent oxidoreductase [Bacteroidota bacterium]